MEIWKCHLFSRSTNYLTQTNQWFDPPSSQTSPKWSRCTIIFRGLLCTRLRLGYHVLEQSILSFLGPICYCQGFKTDSKIIDLSSDCRRPIIFYKTKDNGPIGVTQAFENVLETSRVKKWNVLEFWWGWIKFIIFPQYGSHPLLQLSPSNPDVVS